MISKYVFGKTGHLSSRTIFGASALGSVSAETADGVLEILQTYGVNHIDTAASYGDSELHVGRWMEKYRDDFFLATKTEKRTYKGAWDELQRSLVRLRTDKIDLWQMHYLVDPQEWETAFGPDGAIQAFIEAREKGIVRYLGVTGHDVAIAAMHLKSLQRFPLDSILLPYNYMMMQNQTYAIDFWRLIDVCRERNVAIQTIKSLARGPWGHKKQNYATWYEPLNDQSDIDLAVHWVLSQPDFFLNTTGDVGLLPRVLEAASRFEKGPSEVEMGAMADQRQLTPLFK